MGYAILIGICIAILFVVRWVYTGVKKDTERRRAEIEKYQKQILASGIHMVDQMDGREFEYKLLLHFKSQGFHAEMTPASNDYGADLVMVSPSGQKFVVQAKRYSKTVGVKAVQEVASARDFYGASHAIVVTNAFFSKNAITLANTLGVELWDRNTLINEFSLHADDYDNEEDSSPLQPDPSLPSKLIVVDAEQELPALYSDLPNIEEIRNRIIDICTSIRDTNTPIPNILITGPYFAGNREIPLFIASKAQRRLHIAISECFLTKSGCYTTLTTPQDGDILYIPEPSFSQEVEETFVKGISERRLEVTVGEGPHSRVIHLELAKFTLICSTSRDYETPLSPTIKSLLSESIVI